MMTLTCPGARPGLLRLGYRYRPRSETTVRCAGSPFDDAKNTASTSSASPFGGAAAPPFGSGAKSIAADPFASAARVSPKKQSEISSEKAMKRAAGTEYQAWDDVDVFEVPSELRRPGKDAVKEHVKFYGLEELFPGTCLEAAFNSSAEFRTGIRKAMRDDLFIEDNNMSDEANAAIRSLSSSLMVNWKTSKTGYAAFTELFEQHGVAGLDGKTFIQTLGALCGEESHGSLIDITGTGRRKERHSWHQDSGLERFTVMLGFPPESKWSGVGVFSHSCKLSHPLRQDGEEGTIIQWEDLSTEDLPVQTIGRPEYREGQEVMVYCDATHIHSAPDETNRESVWRFM